MIFRDSQNYSIATLLDKVDELFGQQIKVVLEKKKRLQKRRLAFTESMENEFTPKSINP